MLLLAAAVPFAAAVSLLRFRGSIRNRSGWLAAGASALGFAYFATWVPAVRAGAVGRAQGAWAPALDVRLDLFLDGLSLAFALLITGAGALIALYGASYFSAEEDHARFFALLLLFEGAMLGVVLSGNLLVLVISWELTSLTSFFLIGFWHERAAARAGAMKALLTSSYCSR